MSRNLTIAELQKLEREPCEACGGSRLLLIFHRDGLRSLEGETERARVGLLKCKDCPAELEAVERVTPTAGGF